MRKHIILVLIVFLFGLFATSCESEKIEVIPNAAVTQEKETDTDTVKDTNTVKDTDTVIDQDGYIVFENEANGDYNFEVYIMKGNGTENKKLTDNPGYDGSPSLSPNLKKIAFASARDGNVNIYIYDLESFLNGKEVNVIKLTTQGNNYVPVWSVDGQTIFFQSDRDGTYRLYKMNADGTDQKVFIDNLEASYPAVSPDGKMIAFSAKYNGNNDIYTMNLDGTNLVKITDSSEDDQFAAWSPNGEKIAYSSIGENGSFDLYIMDASGENQLRLVDNYGLDEFPKWSPDGKRIIFRSSITGTDQITIMDIEGTNIEALTQMKGMSIPYDWKW